MICPFGGNYPFILIRFAKPAMARDTAAPQRQCNGFFGEHRVHINYTVSTPPLEPMRNNTRPYKFPTEGNQVQASVVVNQSQLHLVTCRSQTIHHISYVKLHAKSLQADGVGTNLVFFLTPWDPDPYSFASNIRPPPFIILSHGTCDHSVRCNSERYTSAKPHLSG